MFRRISHKVLFLLVASLTLVACDSNEDGDGDATDAERFVGNWTVVSAADQDGARDQTAVFADLGVLTVDLADDDTFSLLLQYTDPAEDDLSLSGPYTVNSAGRQLVLTVNFQGLTVDLPFAYVFNTDDMVELTVDGPTLALLLGEPLEGNVVLGIQKAS